MQIIRGIQNIKPEHHGSVATIGNFDGVHLGHQYVLGKLAEKGAVMGLPVVLIIFEPQPQEFFLKQNAPSRLTRFREKINALLRLAVNRVLVLRFNAKLANQSPEDFIDQVLIQGLGVRHLVVGSDFRFGKNRIGDFKLLQDAGKINGFRVESMYNFKVDDERVSSTRVRQSLAVGDLDLAKKLLGRPYRICGRVAHGDKRGRDIGFPTANIHLHRRVTPLKGVFAVQVFGVDVEPVSGVANLGVRPTVNGVKTILEVHLFEFNSDIYGQYVAIDFLHKIRNEQKFDSFDFLKQQINQDVIKAKDYLIAYSTDH